MWQVIHPSTQVWVYEEADDSGEPNLYVHHDIMLPAFPFSLAWIDCSPSDPSSVANLAAVRPFPPSLQCKLTVRPACCFETVKSLSAPWMGFSPYLNRDFWLRASI